MRQVSNFTTVSDISLYRRYLQQMFVISGVLLFSLYSGSASALITNPGATCTNISGASQGSLTNTDYSNLVAAVNNSKYVDIAGNASGSIPLRIKINTSESNTNTILSNFGVIEANGDRAINIRRTFPNSAASTEITLDFQNSITAQPMFLSNVALSAFDIDYSNSYFDDAVKITGITQTNTEIKGTFQSISGSNVRDDNQGLITNNINLSNCPAKNLSNVCQGSVQFSEAVSSVKIRYGNYVSTNNSSPTNQEIDFRVDNYCYVPQYIFSGTIFDDNGGIPAGDANKDNANITTGPYANRPKYFNGIFDRDVPEIGIANSTVRLTDCGTTPTIYNTQSVIRDDAPVGEYQISIPKTSLGSNTNLCLLESRTGASYPIRTTSESKNVGFAVTTYNYPNNNFGRVIAANAALVLRKAQYVNGCPSTLNYTATNLNTPENTNPRAGFSESAINGNNGNALTPGQCIAYRIIATNRSNLVINDFVMQDKLQKKGVAGALVTSTLIGPVFNTNDYASDSVAIGLNGLVKTKALTLNPRTSRNFYFNTKYGNTDD